MSEKIKLEIGDIVYVKPKSKLRGWQPGVNYVITIIKRYYNHNFSIHCLNSDSSYYKRFTTYSLPPNEYEFYVYYKQFVRSVECGTIKIFKKKNN